MDVIVATLPAELEQHGLDRINLQTDVEAKLRQAGIKISEDSRATLHVNLTTVTIDDTMFAFTITVELIEWVYSERMALARIMSIHPSEFLDLPPDNYADRIKTKVALHLLPNESNEGVGYTSVPRPTWTKTGLGIAGHRKVPAIGDSVKDFLNEFIHHWLKVNPKPW